MPHTLAAFAASIELSIRASYSESGMVLSWSSEWLPDTPNSKLLRMVY